MTQLEFDTLMEFQIKDYARENVEAGFWEESESLEKAKNEINKLLPNGLETKDHFLFSLMNDTNENVGVIWANVQKKKNYNLVFIYYIEIFESHRGKGLSKQALKSLEDWCRSNEISKIGLHVFAKNTVARNLYKKFGFEDINYNMTKKLF